MRIIHNSINGVFSCSGTAESRQDVQVYERHRQHVGPLALAGGLFVHARWVSNVRAAQIEINNCFQCCTKYIIERR